MEKWRLVLALLLLTTTIEVIKAQTWIWYPGDFEIWLGNKMSNRRTERGAFFPHFWKMDSHYNLVEFSKTITLTEPEKIEIATEGHFNLKLNGKLQFGMPKYVFLPAGTHRLHIKIFNQVSPPALFVRGTTVFSDASWKVTFEDKEWIDQSGKASDTSATIYLQAASEQFNDINQPPSLFRLSATPMEAISATPTQGGILYDFGKQTFGFIQLHGLRGNGRVQIFYGESREEALDTAFCETLDKLEVKVGEITDMSLNHSSQRNALYTLQSSKAYRYVFVKPDPTVSFGQLTMLYEYRPVTYRGKFRCNDDEINRIWDIGAYTMHLTTREFFVDGIKRDRWVWSGDAIQSYLMNYYLFFDNETVRRTAWLLRGKDPVTSHINTIMDYSFFWFLSIWDYYQFTGDRHFVTQIYPRMQSMMEFILGRTNKRGMVEGLSGDWVFVDWADGFMDKKGELSFQQVLFARSLETMAICAELYGDSIGAAKYRQHFEHLRSLLIPAFWNDEKKALVHNSIDGKQKPEITRYSNMFAVFYNYLPMTKQQQIKHSVLLNDNIMKITTPYMRFYELEALCKLGEHAIVMQEIKNYWGGMLREGATSFWEKYNPSDTGTQHLAMYGRPYGKSLCHAWGASPIYLLGRYYLGVQPLKAGYEEFSITPNLGGLTWMEGTVPTPKGDIGVFVDQRNIRISSPGGIAYLTLKSKTPPRTSVGSVTQTEKNTYLIRIEGKNEVTVRYRL